jgi:hypothetical protein
MALSRGAVGLPIAIPDLYEGPLTMADGTVRLSDFTINRVGRASVYWEHLGMLDKPGVPRRLGRQARLVCRSRHTALD